MSAGKTYTVVWNEAMANDAVNTYVMRRTVQGQKAFWLVALLMLALFWWLLDRGDRSWILGMAALGASLPWLLLVLVWTAHWRNTVARLRRLPELEGAVSFRSDGLAIDGGPRPGVLPWPTVTDVWERPGYMMAFTGDQEFAIVPTEGIAEIDLERLRRLAKKPARKPKL